MFYYINIILNTYNNNIMFIQINNYVHKMVTDPMVQVIIINSDY